MTLASTYFNGLLFSASMLCAASCEKSAGPSVPVQELQSFSAAQFSDLNRIIEYDFRFSMVDEDGQRFEAVDTRRVDFKLTAAAAPEGCGTSFVEHMTHSIASSTNDDWNDTDYTTDTHFCLGTEGLVEFQFASSTGVANKKSTRVLPEVFAVGDTWKQASQTCRATRTPFCEDGVAIACLSSRESTLWKRNHYCPSWGNVGEEALSIRDDGEVDLRAWSDQFRVGGLLAPYVPASSRQLDEDGLRDFAEGLKK